MVGTSTGSAPRPRSVVDNVKSPVPACVGTSTDQPNSGRPFPPGEPVAKPDGIADDGNDHHCGRGCGGGRRGAAAAAAHATAGVVSCSIVSSVATDRPLAAWWRRRWSQRPGVSPRRPCSSNDAAAFPTSPAGEPAGSGCRAHPPARPSRHLSSGRKVRDGVRQRRSARPAIGGRWPSSLLTPGMTVTTLSLAFPAAVASEGSRARLLRAGSPALSRTTSRPSLAAASAAWHRMWSSITRQLGCSSGASASRSVGDDLVVNQQVRADRTASATGQRQQGAVAPPRRQPAVTVPGFLLRVVIVRPSILPPPRTACPRRAGGRGRPVRSLVPSPSGAAHRCRPPLQRLRVDRPPRPRRRPHRHRQGLPRVQGTLLPGHRAGSVRPPRTRGSPHRRGFAATSLQHLVACPCLDRQCPLARGWKHRAAGREPLS